MSARAGKRGALIAVAALCALAVPAWAHKPSDAHVQLALSGARLDGTVAVALRDLDGALDLDADGDGAITWREAQAAGPRIEAYVRARLSVRADGSPCSLSFGAAKLSDYSDGAYGSLPVTGACPAAPSTLSIAYSLLFDIDAQHRGIVQVRTPRGSTTLVVRDARPVDLDVGDGGVLGSVGAGFAWAATNVALLLCLACLAVPALLDRRDRRWRARPLRAALPDVRASAFAFALASAASALAATAGWLALPSHVLAIAVVLTVAIAAAVNLVRTTSARWDLGFELGLLHGLAAASALRALGPSRPLSTLSFFLGVAVSELASLALLASLAFLARRTLAHRPVLYAWLAAALAALAWALWLS